jgi:type VI secretion system secreted protein VgrG
VLHRVTHALTQQSYTNTFEAFPATAPFRPVRMTARPVIAGVQTAIVVGKNGEEIWTDQYGRAMLHLAGVQQGEMLLYYASGQISEQAAY